MGHKRKPASISDIKVEKPGLNLTYPKVSGLKHKSAEAGINRYIKKEVHEVLKEEGYGNNEDKKFTGGYSVKLNKRGTLSILIEIYCHKKGETHGKNIRKNINISLKDARIYHMDDIFSRKIRRSKYINRINELIKDQIQFKAIKLNRDFDTISKDQEYYLTETSLVVYFQVNQFTALEYGFPEFDIPFNDILDIVNSKGPIGRLLKAKEEVLNNEETADI